MAIKNRTLRGPRMQEDQAAEELGGKRVLASGSMRHDKGDVVTQNYLLDAKQTGQRSFAMSVPVLSKLCLEAVRRKKRPALQVELEAMPAGQRKWAVISWDDFLALVNPNGD